MRVPRVPFRLMLTAVLVGTAGSYATARANTPQEAAPADTVPQEAAPTDTLEQEAARADTVPRDSAAADLEARRAALSEGDYPEPDDLFREMTSLPGYRIVEYRGQRVELDIDRETVKLAGDAQANYTSSVLNADSVTYMARLQFIAAQGDVRLTGEGVREITNDSSLFYDVSSQKGTIMDARTAFAERGSEWFVRGTATIKGTAKAYVETGQFTSCEIEAPHYFFKAGQIKVVNDEVIVAWPVVLYIQNVPIAWLPFFAQDIRPGRRSGFLPPQFGFNDVLGGDNFERQISDFGYYFALSEFYDAQATIDWFSGRYTRINGAFRYRVRKKFLEGNVTASYSVGSDDTPNTLELRLNHNQELSPVTDFKVSANFVQNTQVHQDQSFDPETQTQDIFSDLGFNHRFPFASVALSARRRQFVGDQTGRIDMTLPRLNISFSPVTLFRAPPSQAGPFNNLTFQGAANFVRQEQRFETNDDRITTTGGANGSLRLGRLSISGRGNVDDRRTVPFDSLAPVPPPAFSRTTATYGGSASYQIDLFGSTTLRPSVNVDGATFKSPDTEDRFVAAPTRLSLAASLSSDLYGFLPGFASFSRVRHKISTRFNWAYAPEVSVADSLLEIPGFPVGNAEKRHTLSFTLNQTFEAKLEEEESSGEAAPGRSDRRPRGAVERAGSEAVPPDSLHPPSEGEPAAAPPDSAAVGALEGAGEPQDVTPSQETQQEMAPSRETPQETEADTTAAVRGRTLEGPFRDRQRQRNVVLLAINSSALQFDFTRKGEQALVTDRWRHQVSSDLLRGLSLNFTLDLFEGTGGDRHFQPILSELTGSFSFSSARGVGGIFGLGGAGGARRAAPDPGRGIHDRVDSRYRLSRFDERRDDRFAGEEGAGPWTLSLVYSLSRLREDEPGDSRQSLGANLSLRPTPNWRLQWRTQYDLTEKEFGQHLVTLERDLHRWLARFVFSRSPNGNFLFQVAVSLRDAPDLKLDWDQQTINQ